MLDLCIEIEATIYSLNKTVAKVVLKHYK